MPRNVGTIAGNTIAPGTNTAPGQALKRGRHRTRGTRKAGGTGTVNTGYGGQVPVTADALITYMRGFDWLAPNVDVAHIRHGLQERFGI